MAFAAELKKFQNPAEELSEEGKVLLHSVLYQFFCAFLVLIDTSYYRYVSYSSCGKQQADVQYDVINLTCAVN